MRQPLELALAFALHVLLVVAVAQAWMSDWPGKIWLTAGTALAILASGALIRRWRAAPLIIGCVATAAIFLWPALRYGPDASGLKIGGVTFGTATAALIIGALAIAAAQLWKLASTPRLPRWVRFIPAVFALYAIALIGLGITRGAATSGVLAGEGPVPWWISGPYLGTAVLLPLALLVSVVVLGIAIARRRAGVATAAGVLVLMLSAFVVSGLELTRNGRPNLAQFVVPASFVSTAQSVSGIGGESTAVLGSLGAGEENLAPFEGRDLDEIFARVATGVRYEPYTGILRGAIGTAVARSANSADHAMLLGELLRRAGYKVRYSRGQMASENINAVIRGMYPPRLPELKLADDYRPYDPAADTKLREIVGDHMWVEVLQDDGWLPLDASFPRAKVGETYAASTEQFDTPPDALYHTIDATLREETATGTRRELARFSGKVAELALTPISLVVRSVPQSAGGDAPGKSMGSPAGAMGGMGGALGGATEAPAPSEPTKKIEKKIVGVAYVRSLTVGATSQKVARTTVLAANPQSRMRREWIEFNLVAPRSLPRRVERILYQLDEKNKEPAGERRYTISLVAGRVSRIFAEQQTRIARSIIDPEAIQQRANRLAGISPDDSRAVATAAELTSLDDGAGTVTGHLLAIRFAAESDSISRIIADGTGVALAWAIPRILISSVETTTSGKNRTDAKVSLDLRLDEVTTYPYPGAPARLAQIFLAARGIQESVIEGGLVGLLGGQDQVANTASLMEAAYDEDIPLVVISASTRSAVNQLAAPPKSCVEMIDAALARGHEVIVPVRAVTLAGAARWGWWEVDPVTNSVVGVMESGEHQGVAEYTLSTEKVGLDDDTGRMIGSLVGSITTMGTLSALLLKHGTVTPVLIEELKAAVQSIMCVMCFNKIEAKVGREIKLSIGDECFKQEFKKQIGVEAKIGFCDNYIEGFKCATGIIYAALERKPFDNATYEAGVKLEVGCKEYDQLKKKAGTG